MIEMYELLRMHAHGTSRISKRRSCGVSCVGSCGFGRSCHPTHSSRSCKVGETQHGPACGKIAVDELATADHGADYEKQLAPVPAPVNEDAVSMTPAIPTTVGDARIVEDVHTQHMLNHKVAEPWGPCRGNCGLAKTWHRTHCCYACKMGMKEHGALCRAVPLTALHRVPPLGSCAGSCGFGKSWHPTHCCYNCKVGATKHGPACGKMP